ncbi:MAG TPA: hypothetical protein VNK04_14875 [Gemmataceae bacterium]|nr:hypothetical protein [Gemmataceae bacterium]
MSGPLATAAVLLLALGFAAPLHADSSSPSAAERAKGPAPEAVKSAVRRAAVLMQKSGAEYLRHRECFSCHHQGVPILALSTARARGFEVDEEGLQRQVRFTADFLAKNRENYEKGRGQGGQADTAGYALWALEAGGWKPDETTSAVAEYLLLRDKDQDHWRTVSKRPPSEASSFTTTYLALRGLRVFGIEAQQERIAGRTEQVRRWLRAAPAVDTEDRVFRLWGLKYADADDKEIQAAAQELLRTQRQDGGWTQTDDLESDAYATGSALAALHLAGGLPTSDPAYQRGMTFLIASQLEDGSWLVRSRSRPFQLYFESGFPHGKDQWISSTATAWAVMALALACPPAADK